MENISRIKEKCVGCKSCEQSCPKHCISIGENKEGFWYPIVDEKNCVECGKCLKTCPAENIEQHRNMPQTVWAWRNKNDADIMKSASGGAADSAAKAVLQMGGVVYGAAYDDQLVVSHIEIESEGKNINAKSLMGIMAFGLKKGMEVSISAKGTDEKAAVDCISQFLTSNAECAM